MRTDASGTARLRVPESWAHYFRVQVAETQRLWGDTSSPAKVWRQGQAARTQAASV